MSIVQPLNKFVQRKMIQMNQKACTQLEGEAQAAMNDVRDMDIGEIDGFDLKERTQKLNSDQLRVFENISGHLYHQWQHEQGVCHCNALKPLHTFISGVGGTGKSFLIETIR